MMCAEQLPQIAFSAATKDTLGLGAPLGTPYAKFAKRRGTLLKSVAPGPQLISIRHHVTRRIRSAP